MSKINDLCAGKRFGKVAFLTDLHNEQQGMYLNIDQSLKNYKSIDVKNFSLKSIVEKKRLLV